MENLEAAAQGNLYRIETDDAEAYTKAIASDVMPWATMDKLGAKTLVWNQLAKNPTFDGFSEWTVYGCEVSTSNGVVTVTNASVGTWNGIRQSVKCALGHIYLGMCDLMSEKVRYADRNMSSVGFVKGEVATDNNTYDTAGAWKTVYQIIRITEVRASGAFQIYPFNYTGSEVGDVAYVKNARVFDLTAMFGAGNEPDAETFRAMFPADYYPYSEPTLMSFAPVEVENRGRNLIHTNEQFWSDSSGVTRVKNDDGTVTFNGTASGTAYYFFHDGGKYDQHLTPGKYMIGLAIVDGSVSVPGSLNLTVAYRDATNTQVTLISTAPNYTMREFEITEERSNYIVYIRGSGGLTFNNCRMRCWIVKGDTEIPYAPYREPITYTYADLSQKYFPEGMHSIGNVYDEINLERKVAIRRVGCVDLGTLTWASASGYDGVFFTTIVAETASVKIGGSVISSHYLSGLAVNSVSKVVDGTICASTITSRIMIGDSTYKNATLFKTDMNGVMAFFELAEPIETPIAPEDLDGLTDINVEPGGSLVFINGDDENYRIPVPNQETFIVKLGGGN